MKIDKEIYKQELMTKFKLLKVWEAYAAIMHLKSHMPLSVTLWTTQQQEIEDLTRLLMYMCIIEFIKRVGEEDKMRGFAKHLIVFPNKFNKFHNTGAWMQDSIYHMTLKLHFISKFCTKTSRFCH